MSASSDPRISVVIPTYGRPDLLLSCVSSIINGRYDDYEILIIDQDPSQSLRQNLPQHFPNEGRLRYLYTECAGAARARNAGLDAARGEVVAFIDDDLLADSCWLEAIDEALLTVQCAPALIAGRIDPIWPSKRPEWLPQECEYLLGLYNIGDQLCLMPEDDQPMSANMAGLREHIQALGGFDESFGFNYFRNRPMIAGEDSMLGHRARRAGYALYYQPRARACHQISETKLSRRYFLRRHFWEGVTVIMEMHSLGQLNTVRQAHLRYHAKAIVKSLVASLLPNQKYQTGRPRSTLRMLALSQAAYSLGVIYSVLTLDRGTER